MASRAALDGGRNNPTPAQTPQVVWRPDVPKQPSFSPSNDRQLWNGAVQVLSRRMCVLIGFRESNFLQKRQLIAFYC
jgi:hypothetical protein